MADLDERFRSLSRTGTPDLWRTIEEREPLDGAEPPMRRRLAAAVVALVVAAAGFIGVTLALGGAEPRQASAPAADGRIAFVAFADSAWQVFSTAPAGSGLLQLTALSPGTYAEDPAWSGDGTRLAYVVRQEHPDPGRVWVMDADGSEPSELLELALLEGSPVADPAWSPDGREMALAVYGDAGGIYVTSLDGGGPRRLTGTGPGVRHQDSEPVWSPDGGSIAFVRKVFAQGRGGVWQILRVEASGGEPAVLAEFPDRDTPEEPGLSWSPDGSRIAFSLHGGIRVLDLAGGTIEEIVKCEVLGCDANTIAFTDSPSWSPDGSQIAFEAWLDTPSNRTEPPVIYIATLEGDEVTVASTGIEGFSPAWGTAVSPGEPDEPIPSPIESQPTDAQVVETFEVGEVVSSLAYGEGSVWVATSSNDGSFGGRILRIDPVTHDVVAEIPVHVIPTWEVGGGAMVIEDGSLWVTGSLEAPGAFDDPGGGADAGVIRIDTSTNEVAQTFELGGTHGADLTFLDGGLWVLLFGDETVDHRMEVVGVDPATGDALARIPLETRWAHTVVAVDGRLVVLESGPGATNAAGHAAVIDPVRGAISRVEVPSDYITPMPVISGGQVWISLDPGFARFDPRTVAFPDTPASLPPRFSDCCGFVEADDRGIWFLNLAANGTDRGLNLFDPGTGEVRELVVLKEGSPVAMAVAPGSVWILNHEGTLTHVALG